MLAYYCCVNCSCHTYSRLSLWRLALCVAIFSPKFFLKMSRRRSYSRRGNRRRSFIMPRGGIRL